MQNYGMIIDGKLFSTSKPIDGSKPIVWDEIPAFDESTQYITQRAPVDEGDRIFIGVEVHDLPPQEENKDMF
jgi:hypothetical protein